MSRLEDPAAPSMVLLEINTLFLYTNTQLYAILRLFETIYTCLFNLKDIAAKNVATCSSGSRSGSACVHGPGKP